MSDDSLWGYNCKDTVYTREVGETLQRVLTASNLTEVDAWQQRLFRPVLQAMLRGVRIRPEARNQMAMDIQEELSHREAFLYNTLGHTINPSSPKQMATLFYEDLKLPVVYKRVVAGGRVVMNPTCDDEALQKIAAKEPLVKPLCNAIADIRTLQKLLNDFVLAAVDEDGRMRCSYNIAGDAQGKSAPYSYRLSSSKNAFGSGLNLQTVPSSKSKSSGKAANRGSMDFAMPNVRTMYGPDPGFTFFDGDLDRADLQIVVRESGEKDWMEAMKLGIDMHLLNAFVIAKKNPPPMEELVETHPKYPDHRGPLKHAREFAKVFCHASNYGGGAKTVAAHTGRTVQEIDAAQKYWFSAHPGIAKWHMRTFEQINKYRFVENAWGYRWNIFDRLEALLPEALAWVPQCVPLDCEVLTRLGWRQIGEVCPTLEIAVWDTTGKITFEVPSRWNRGVTKQLVDLPELGYKCTPNHRIPYRTGDSSEIRTRTVLELPQQARVPMGGQYSGELEPSEEELIYIVALQADGHWDFKRDAIQFEFQKPRKIERLTHALNTLGIPYTKSLVRRGATTFYIPKGKHKLHSDLKYYGPWLLQLSAKALDFLLLELEFWDGWRSPQGELWYSSSVRENCEWIHTIAALRGKRVRWMSDDTRSARTNYRITLAPNKGKYTVIPTRNIENTLCEVACPTTSTGYFLLRKGNTISVTGNSSVGILINRIWISLAENVPEVQVLGQVHDSLFGQIPTHRMVTLKPLIEQYAQIPVPYPEPLIIPFGLKTSPISWGDC